MVIIISILQKEIEAEISVIQLIRECHTANKGECHTANERLS